MKKFRVFNFAARRPGLLAVVALVVIVAAAVVAWSAVGGYERLSSGLSSGPGPSPALVNAELANPAAYPWYCHVRGVGRNTATGPVAGPLKASVVLSGALISSTQVLTALGSGVVRAGTPVTIGGRETRFVKSVWRQPFMGLDVLELDRPSAMRPIKKATQQPAFGAQVVAVGRGAEPERPDSRLRRGVFTYVSPAHANHMLDADSLPEDAQWPERTMAGAPALMAFTSARGTSVCDGDKGAPFFLPKGQDGRTEDELVAIGNLGYCTGPSLVFAFSVPFHVRMKPYAERVRQQLAASCADQRARVITRDGWRCPRDAPWFSGVAGAREWPYAFFGDQIQEVARYSCSKTPQCAKTIRDMYATLYDPKAGPVRMDAA